MEHNEELKNLREEYLRLKEKLDELSKKDLDYVTNENTMLKELHERVFDAGTLQLAESITKARLLLLNASKTVCLIISISKTSVFCSLYSLKGN